MALGVPHPRFLEQLLSSSDITDWIAYAEEEPFGDARQDIRDGTIAALIYNTNRDSKKDPQGRAWWDFFRNAMAPPKEPEALPPDADDQQLSENFWHLMNATFNHRKPSP